MSATEHHHKTTTGMKMEHAGSHPVAQEDAERWKQDNHQAMQELNRITDEYGLLSDSDKSF
ncbi:post-segregation antitoxin (ccd killing protein) [Erwinia toletana]|uniref:Post-segregation antitoxin (Ccd killing protein) n=1 Tax=Winslowiella toletana TaxID=92490 RepID=A0ABS4P8Z1_9GAMM|nr:type II toxin-antitoxin system CcdA family antitoxin [Winslowiella toletana]MBP2169092.1 post-segregation antitoxin (ccd killing protein) [Winslowiella toletana]